MHTRRQILVTAAAAAFVPLSGVSAAAEPYPQRPIRIVFPFPAGGVAELLRLVSDKLGERLGVAVVFEPRPGASGNPGAEFVARADPDGHTLLMTPPPPLAVNQSLFATLGYDPAAFVPVSIVATMPIILVAARGLPAASVRELIDQARAQPGKFSYASTGNGGTPHLTAERFNAAAGVKMVHVPYQGISAALPDLVAGRVDLMWANMSGVMPLVNDGRLKVLAVASAMPQSLLPGVPTVQEALPGFVAEAWMALAAPPGTPLSIVERLSGVVAEIIRQPEVVERFRQQGAVPRGGTATEARTFIREESQRAAEAIRLAGIRAE
jgi:tripartite-type tricarboxylate transporter receptor subunit TctC